MPTVSHAVAPQASHPSWTDSTGLSMDFAHDDRQDSAAPLGGQADKPARDASHAMASRLLMRRRMVGDTGGFRHAGGGPKGLFLILRYVFIAATAYLVIFQDPGEAISAGPAIMIAVALASNVALSMLPAHYLFAWY